MKRGRFFFHERDIQRNLSQVLFVLESVCAFCVRQSETNHYLKEVNGVEPHKGGRVSLLPNVLFRPH